MGEGSAAKGAVALSYTIKSAGFVHGRPLDAPDGGSSTVQGGRGCFENHAVPSYSSSRPLVNFRPGRVEDTAAA